MPSSNALQRQAGQCLMVGFDGLEAPADLLTRLAAGRAGSVILFARNVEEPRQLAALNSALLEAAPSDSPLLISVDQEGGRVQRLRDPWPHWPTAAALGATGDAAVIRRVGEAMGRELAACGIELDLAPVLDVHTNPVNPVIGDRAFAPTPAGVIAAAGAFTEGLERAGVAACGKHFPGHGDTHTDSHFDLPELRHDRDRLDGVELAPFAALASRLPALMSAHIVFHALDTERPATLSPAVVGTLLRHTLGFSGLLLSDDLEMKAVAHRYEPEVLAVACLRAGIDLLCVCHEADRQERMLEALIREAESHVDFAARLAEASTRVGSFKKQWCHARPPDPEQALSIAQNPNSHALADRLRDPASP